MRESGGEQLLSTWLMALWRRCACPAEPFVRLPPAVAVIGRCVCINLVSLRLRKRWFSIRLPFTVSGIHAPCRLICRLIRLRTSIGDASRCYSGTRVSRAAPPRLGRFKDMPSCFAVRTQGEYLIWPVFSQSIDRGLFVCMFVKYLRRRDQAACVRSRHRVR